MKIQVSRRKLGKERAHGLAWQHLKKIEIDPRLTPKKELEILIHEAAHIVFPTMAEKDAEKLGVNIGRVLWKEGYRKP